MSQTPYWLQNWGPVSVLVDTQTIMRKNSLFAGFVGGGRTWATIANLLQTCKMSSVDSYAWAQLTLECIANHWPNNDIEAPMPWNFKPLR